MPSAPHADPSPQEYPRRGETSGTVSEAQTQWQFQRASVYRLPFGDGVFDWVVACEVLEHLERPGDALREIGRVCKGHVLVSVPWEPVWRLLNMVRGSYLQDLGNTPGHLQHFSRGGIRRLVRSQFEIVAERKPFPWTMLLARAPDKRPATS